MRNERLAYGSLGHTEPTEWVRVRLLCAAVLGLDNFNEYYPSSLKRDRQTALQLAGVHVVDADLNDDGVLRELFRLCTFTHVLHLAAQVWTAPLRCPPRLVSEEPPPVNE